MTACRRRANDLILIFVAALIVAITALSPHPVWAQTLSDLPLWAQERRSPDRLALVMGLGDYPGSLRLAAPEHDSVHVRRVLVDLDFNLVEPTSRLDRKGMLDAVAILAQRTKPGDVIVVYFSGHGLQRNGQNYLIPLDADAPLPHGEDYAYVNLADVLQPLLGAGPGAIYVVLDACREDPFAAVGPSANPIETRFEPTVDSSLALNRVTDGGRGLAVVPMQLLRRTTVVFTASSGQAAYSFLTGDTPEKGSLYTRALTTALADNAYFNRAFNDASTQIWGWTSDRQFPEVRESGAPLLALRPDESDLRQEEKVWVRAVRQAQGDDEAPQLREYLRKNPVSGFAWAARRRLATLGAEENVSPTPLLPPAIADAVWAETLRSPTIDALQQPSAALIAATTALVRPRNFLGFALPDARLRSLDIGTSIQVVAYDAASRSARIALEDGTMGLLRNVELRQPRIIGQQLLAYDGADIDAALIDVARLDTVLSDARQDDTTLVVRTGLAAAETSGRAEQIAYARALELKDQLMTRGVAADRIQLEIGDAEVIVDQVLIQVRQN